MPRIPTTEIIVDGKRKIVNADDPRAASEAKPAGGTTRTDVAKMPRAEVVELLEAHGVTDTGDEKLTDLRKTLAGIMFVDL